MTRCPACEASAPAGSRYCGSCGAALDENVETRTSSPSEQPTDLAPPNATGSSSPQEGRFEPGALLGERYRVVSLLGRGGMGEVYRADDLKLGQPVALKFLPREVERDASRLRRFHEEVRLALKVTHPNVTRTYDIGEVDGHHYIAMEYVDGEDLASLLRRIGRLPSDKANQVARQICAGLAAAHDRGVLHRDLKPANVMLDGRGQVKITDFGLASVGESVDGHEAIAGTPAYMAPEQWEGQGVSARSDIYALGLVLYELFTGQSIFAGKTPAEIRAVHSDDSSTATDSAPRLADLEPAVERTIVACLEADAGRRPQSPLAVAAALPGGDPVAAALAAGETPAPELLASSAAAQPLSSTTVWSLVAAVVTLAFGMAWLSDRVTLPGRAALPRPPQYLEVRAQEILGELGLGDLPIADSVSWFDLNYAWVDHTLEQQPQAHRWRAFEGLQPSTYRFHYRQSPVPFERQNSASLSNWTLDPPAVVPGMVEVVLDPEGNLVDLHLVPTRSSAAVEDADPDWSILLLAAGFEPEELMPTAPETNPAVFADRRRSWVGSYPLNPDIDVTLEAASLGAQIVDFRLREPWDRVEDPEGPVASAMNRFAIGWLLQIWMGVVLLTAILLGWRNMRLGRGDLRSAMSFGLYGAAFRLLAMLAGHHSGGGEGFVFVISHLRQAVFIGFVLVVFYLALEPFARKLWPRVLVNWVKLWRGEFSDSGVGRDLLVGVLAGLVAAAVTSLAVYLSDAQGVAGPSPANWHGDTSSNVFLMGLRQSFGALAAIHVDTLFGVVMMQVMLLLMRLILRRTWAAAAALALLVVIVLAPGGGGGLTHVLIALSIFAVFLVTIFRFGLLAIFVAVSVTDLLAYLPLTLDVSSWHAGSSFLTLSVLVGLTSWGLWAVRPEAPVS